MNWKQGEEVGVGNEKITLIDCLQYGMHSLQSVIIDIHVFFFFTFQMKVKETEKIHEFKTANRHLRERTRFPLLLKQPENMQGCGQRHLNVRKKQKKKNLVLPGGK